MNGLPPGFRLIEDESPSSLPQGFSLLPEAPDIVAGVTIAPKGGAARDATPEEARQLNPGASFADVASAAGNNLLPSAQRFGSDLANVALHPIDTARNIKNTVSGAAEKLIPGDQGHEKYADAVGQFFASRYGGIENLKKTLAEDPVGFVADAATLLSGGELALARAPGVAGHVARAAGAASRAIDPINATLKAGKAVAKGAGAVAGRVASDTSGVLTGAGGQAVRSAARAGFEGGDAGQAFRANMRGQVPLENVISDAKGAVAQMRQQRSTAYEAGMSGVRADTKVLAFKAIEDSLKKTKSNFTFKGVSLSPSTEKTLREIATVVDEWKRYDPAEFHTAAGFDALKKRLGDIRENAEYGTPQRKIADQVYHVVRGQVAKQAPEYAKTMRGYEQASDLIREMEKTLSLNPKATIDTTLRKLQSVIRNNVNTNWGKRADLARLLEANGAKNLMNKLAGQALGSFEPRGLARAAAAIGGVSAGTAGLLTANPLALPALAGQLALSSPRLAGEVTHAGGRAGRTLSDLGQWLPLREGLQAGYQVRGSDR